MYYYKVALTLVKEKDVVETFNGIALLYKETGDIDSSIYYARQVLEKWKSVAYQRGLLQAMNIMASNYKSSNRDSAIKYLELSVALNNKLYSQENERNIQSMGRQCRQKKAEELNSK